MSEREQMHYDFVVVGAGPAGLACALRLKQLKPDASICVLEKGSTVGAHSLSGAVLEPGPLEALLPDWRASYSGMHRLAVAAHRLAGAAGRSARRRRVSGLCRCRSACI
jgi:electron-transferring-flavoprotein dehydrogenase